MRSQSAIAGTRSAAVLQRAHEAVAHHRRQNELLPLDQLAKELHVHVRTLQAAVRTGVEEKNAIAGLLATRRRAGTPRRAHGGDERIRRGVVVPAGACAASRHR